MKELVTDLRLKFRHDVFLSTRTKLILFHTFSVIAIIFITIELIEYVQKLTLNAVVELVEESLSAGRMQTDILAAATKQIDSAMLYVFGAVIVVSVVTGIVASRLALRPVRDALALQKRFIASIAHELRTPLAILKTQNEVAKLDVQSAQITNTLQENIDEIDHITEILNSLLLFNRVDTLESITFEHVELGRVIENVYKRLKTLAARKRILLSYERSTIPSVYGNETALEQALFNVVKNALNYTKEGGEVRIACSSVTDRDVTIDVSDTGIGIPKKDLPHIFEPFYRARTSQAHGRGTGLGLALVFEIIKLHNGKIRVESTEGSGARFLLTFPREQTALSAQHVVYEGGISYDFTAQKQK